MKKINKSKTAKQLGVSRPTLYKLLENNTDISPLIDARLILNATSHFPTATPSEIETFMEWLQDNKMLTNEGERLRHLIWSEFIKEDV